MCTCVYHIIQRRSSICALIHLTGYPHRWFTIFCSSFRFSLVTTVMYSEYMSLFIWINHFTLVIPAQRFIYSLHVVNGYSPHDCTSIFVIYFVFEAHNTSFSTCLRQVLTRPFNTQHYESYTLNTGKLMSRIIWHSWVNFWGRAFRSFDESDCSCTGGGWGLLI